MKLTLGQAAKHTGVNKSTLSRYIKQGKISAEKQEDGSYRIDPSELDRLNEIRRTDNRFGTPDLQQTDTPSDTKALQRELDLLREQLREKEQLIDELREDRNAWRRHAQTLLLPQPPDTGIPPPETPRSWWRRLWSSR
jgi:excisionase family DNA binding protein